MSKLKFNLTVKDANWYVLKYAPILIEIMSQASHDESEAQYSCEEYITAVRSFMESFEDVIVCADAKEGSPLDAIYQNAVDACADFLIKMMNTEASPTPEPHP